MAKVELYTWTYCPFCVRAKQLLEMKGIPYVDICIDSDDMKRDELYKETGQSTVPYVFINDTFVGGCTELQNLAASGKLDDMCKQE